MIAHGSNALFLEETTFHSKDVTLILLFAKVWSNSLRGIYSVLSSAKPRWLSVMIFRKSRISVRTQVHDWIDSRVPRFEGALSVFERLSEYALCGCFSYTSTRMYANQNRSSWCWTLAQLSEIKSPNTWTWSILYAGDHRLYSYHGRVESHVDLWVGLVG